MRNTSNLALKKYDLTDKWGLQNHNDNWDKVDDYLTGLANIVTATGTGVAIAIAVAGVTAYATGRVYKFVAAANNGAAATTVSVNSLTAKPLYKPGGTTAPKLVAGKAYEIWDGGASFFLKASAEGDATAADVLAGKTFSGDDDTGMTGTLALTGSAGVGDVTNGKTFYGTDPKTKLTGTGANAKRVASGSGTFSNGLLTVSGLGFSPSLVIVLASSGNYRYRLVYHGPSTFNATLYFTGGGWLFRSVNMVGPFGDTSGSSNGYGTFSPVATTDQDWSITADGFTTCKFNSVPTASAQWWAYE